MKLENLLIPVIVGIMMTLLLAASKKKPKIDEEGRTVLKLPLFYTIIGVIALIGGLGLLYVTIYLAGDDRMPAGIGSLITFILGYFLFAKGYISNIVISETGIIETTIFRKQKEILWSEVEGVSFGKVSLELSIRGKGKRIKAHMHMVGFQVLVKQVEVFTGKTKSELGIPKS